MSKTGDILDRVSQTYFEQESKPVLRAYVDLEAIQDLRFGALLSSITVEPEVKYIHSSLARYNNRFDLCTAKYFPALKKTDEELDKLLHTPILMDKICFIAPFTSIYYHLLEALDMFKQHNSRMLSEELKMTLVINCSDIEYPLELQNHLCNVISHMLDINVEFQSIPRYRDDVKIYEKYDFMVLYDYGLFVNSHPKSFVGDGNFVNTRIVAIPYVDPKLGHKPDTYDEVLQSTERGLDIYCDFRFLRSEITLASNKGEING
jgi:hypothetical protein